MGLLSYHTLLNFGMALSTAVLIAVTIKSAYLSRSLKGGQVNCMEVVLCLSQKVARNGQILSMFVPKKWLFSLLFQPHQGWLFKSKNWLMSKICQPLSLVSGFFRSYWFGLLHCHIMDTERSSQPLSLT